ncbi:hypothetical protein G7046_g8050 [Stylonectria norvegica]|nr:hypothetical protein G7046_g8050 [Stylonectria norvegica]
MLTLQPPPSLLRQDQNFRQPPRSPTINNSHVLDCLDINAPVSHHDFSHYPRLAPSTRSISTWKPPLDGISRRARRALRSLHALPRTPASKTPWLSESLATERLQHNPDPDDRRTEQDSHIVTCETGACLQHGRASFSVYDEEGGRGDGLELLHWSTFIRSESLRCLPYLTLPTHTTGRQRMPSKGYVAGSQAWVGLITRNEEPRLLCLYLEWVLSEPRLLRHLNTHSNIGPNDNRNSLLTRNISGSFGDVWTIASLDVSSLSIGHSTPNPDADGAQTNASNSVDKDPLRALTYVTRVPELASVVVQRFLAAMPTTQDGGTMSIDFPQEQPPSVSPL